jgi:hypothetical protein
MPDDYQILIPPSFQALYTDRRQRLSVPLATLRERYELCEDLAQQLVDTAQHLHRDLEVAVDEVLAQLRLGLSGPEAVLSVDEVGWVLRRLAELMDWTLPAPMSR